MTEVATIKRAGFLDEMFRFGGAASVAVADSSSATSATEAETSARLITLTGALTATRTVTLRARGAGADWMVVNGTTGGHVVAVQAVGGTYGIEVGPGEALHVLSLGTGLIAVPLTPNSGEAAICLVDVGATNAATVALNAKQSRAQVVWLVGTMDGAGVELTFASGKADDARTTIVNGTDYAITIPGVTSGAEQIPAGTSRTYTWASGGLVEGGERSMGERAAGRVCSISTAGATTWCPDLEVGNGIAITKNGAGDYTVDYTAVVGMSVIRGAQCTPLGATPVSSAVELVSSYVVRVRMSADAPFTLSVLS